MQIGSHLSIRKRNSLRAWTSLVPLLVLGFFLVVTTSCAQAPRIPPEQAIVGNWVNERGYTISFYNNGTGYIPSVDPQIPPASFSYSFTDETHVLLNMSGQLSTRVQIIIDGDQMTWSSETGVSFVYKRAKQP
jgi:hypothetical protein